MRYIALLLIIILLAGCAREVATSTSKADERGHDELKAEADPIALETNSLKVEYGEDAQLAVAIKNNHGNDAQFLVKPECINAKAEEADIIKNKKGEIPAGETAVIVLDIDTESLKSPYICSIRVESSLGMETSKEFLVEIA